MRFQKKLDLWADGVQDLICSGQIKLQAGQWLICGDSDKPCRYISNTATSINVVHWQGSAAATTAAFNARIDSLRMAKLYNEDRNAWHIEMYNRRNAA